MKKTISKDTPLAELTLRRYEKPYEMARRDLIRKICLSIGLLQPGDSRDVVVDVLQTVLENEGLTSEEITGKVIELRKKAQLPLVGVAHSNVRRQLKRIKDLFLIEKNGNGYRITEKEKISTIFREKIEKFYLPTIIERVKEYLDILDKK
ncbi:hypothetical protein HY643_05255 [Candidatus Woesearchaeota archaeon]|nr:hypothetical protein [Candidatus Woesearchaeota archaeon]